VQTTSEGDDTFQDTLVTYTYQVPVSYQVGAWLPYYQPYKVKAKVRYQVRYRYRGKWRTKWRTKYVYVTKYRLKYYWGYKTLYRYDTRYGQTWMSEYLKETNNCQISDPTIQALSVELSKDKTSVYDKANAIFSWVRDNCDYSFYYNTRYGAVGMLATKNGNCIDHTHLIIALARAAKIPTRYAHAECEFSTMTVGHIWAEIYVNGDWYTADATSYRNSFGTQNNCEIIYMKGRYAQLPF